jgi:hypothetical protein
MGNSGLAPDWAGAARHRHWYALCAEPQSSLCQRHFQAANSTPLRTNLATGSNEDLVHAGLMHSDGDNTGYTTRFLRSTYPAKESGKRTCSPIENRCFNKNNQQPTTSRHSSMEHNQEGRSRPAGAQYTARSLLANNATWCVGCVRTNVLLLHSNIVPFRSVDDRSG